MKKSTIYFILLCVMVTWGMNVIATKVLVANFLPTTMTAFRIFTAGICVFIILFSLKKVRMLTKKEWVYVCLGALFNVVGHHYFLSIGLKNTSATNGGLILGMGPLLSTILAIIFLRSAVTVSKMVGVFFGLLGVYFIVLKGANGWNGVSFGDLYMFISILSQAISFIMIKKVSNTLDPRLMTGFMLIIGSICLFMISLFTEPNGLASMAKGSFSVWLIFFSSAIIATALGHMAYNYAVGKIGVTEAAIFINLNPFFALVGAVLFLGETIVLSQATGFVFIIVGILLGSGALEEFIRKMKRNPLKLASKMDKGM
ncbi:DMT family transporter [Niallia sp. 03091]|uniref:DMT family transporter n=1 Tax=unclassified Niallia TaxID=2837522 RepID=UPI0040444525